MVRAADRDRERATAELGRHFADGRLDAVEFEDRVGRAQAARTVADLDGLFVDLPRRPHRAGEHTEPRTGGDRARRTIGRSPWGSWALTAVVCLAIWSASVLASGHLQPFWPGWVIGPWAGVLLLRRSCGRSGHH